MRSLAEANAPNAEACGSRPQGRTCLMLSSTQPLHREVLSHQQKALIELNTRGYRHETVDGADPANVERRKELVNISGRLGEYPQFFVVNNETGSVKYWGDWEKFQVAMQDGSLAKTFSKGKRKNAGDNEEDVKEAPKHLPPPPPLPPPPKTKKSEPPKEEVKSGCSCTIL